MNNALYPEGSNDPSGFDPSLSEIKHEYEIQQALYRSQPPIVQHFLEAQARTIGEAIVQHLPQVRFSLPDRVVSEVKSGDEAITLRVPPEYREQLAGGLMDRLTRTDLRAALRARLADLDQSSNQAVVISATLIRHATVLAMVYSMLPSGRSVTYKAPDGEEIPSLPVGDSLEPESAITASTDAIAEETTQESGRGELLVPFVPAARRFYLPQWVAFDDQGNLLVNSINEAEAAIASMQHFVEVLHAAVGLAPYIVADPEYQRKRYGILGQLVNQGRQLARYETNDIIRTIWRRAKSNDLNRGLSLSLPYFDDQDLDIKTHEFEVIPAGRIMFVPAFVVRAAREEAAKVAQDTRMDASTRKYLLQELNTLEEAFNVGLRA